MEEKPLLGKSSTFFIMQRLWNKKRKIDVRVHYYEKFGFVSEGISNSKQGECLLKADMT